MRTGTYEPRGLGVGPNVQIYEVAAGLRRQGLEQENYGLPDEGHIRQQPHGKESREHGFGH